jgi:lipoate-protein ligase A
VEKDDEGELSVFETALRVIEDLDLRGPAMNIGLEEAIAETVYDGKSPPTVRFWRNPHSAIIGRSQEAGVELDLVNCDRANLPVVRRPTGGGAVLHHPDNLNYSLYLPEASSSSVEEESVKMSEPVASGLSKLGLDVEVRANGLFLGETKIGGTAQSRRKGLLHHGTLLVNEDSIMKEMISFLKAGRPEYSGTVSRVGSKPDRVSSLTDLLSKRLLLPQIVDVLVDEWSRQLDRRPIWGKISREEWKIGTYLAENKYRSPDWNFRFNRNRNGRELSSKIESGGAG